MDPPTAVPCRERKVTKPSQPTLLERQTIALERQTALIKQTSSDRLVKHCNYVSKSVACMHYTLLGVLMWLWGV